MESSAQEEGRVMVACREHETFTRIQGVCSLRAPKLGVQVLLGGFSMGGASADLGELHVGCSSSLGGAAWLPVTSFQIHFWSSIRWMLLEYSGYMNGVSQVHHPLL